MCLVELDYHLPCFCCSRFFRCVPTIKRLQTIVRQQFKGDIFPRIVSDLQNIRQQCYRTNGLKFVLNKVGHPGMETGSLYK